jgi:hypothetical protein
VRTLERGFALTLVMLGLMVIELIGIGVLSLAASDLHGAVSSRLSLQAFNLAEGGLHYATAVLAARATAEDPTDERYAGESRDLQVSAPGGNPLGSIRLDVGCVYPAGAIPPACQDDPGAPGVSASDFRELSAVATIPAWPGRARRELEATVRRYRPRGGDVAPFGVCGRDGVDLDRGTVVTTDVGSNDDIHLGPGSAIRQLPLRAPSSAPAAIGGSRPPGATLPGLSGIYSWRVTFVDERERESSASPPSKPLTLQGEYGHVTDLPAGDRAIVARRLYRTRADQATIGPWLLVAEIRNPEARDYTDPQPDSALGPRAPGTISGRALAGGLVDCAGSCATQVDGPVVARARSVPCPGFLPPPCLTGSDPAPSVIVQERLHDDRRFAALHVGPGEILSILTLGDPLARLHIHVSEVTLERDSLLVVTGAGTVYLHVAGAIRLKEGAVIGGGDDNPESPLIAPADRLQLLSCARDPKFDPAEPSTASVRWDGRNRVAAFVFAPDANMVIDGARIFTGPLFGRRVILGGSLGTVVDPSDGIASERTGVRPTPFQYLTRWYDRPISTP